MQFYAFQLKNINQKGQTLKDKGLCPTLLENCIMASDRNLSIVPMKKKTDLKISRGLMPKTDKS